MKKTKKIVLTSALLSAAVTLRSGLTYLRDIRDNTTDII